MEGLKARFALLGATDRARNVCLRVTTSSHVVLALLLTILVCESVTLVLKSHGKLFWYDELVTFRVSALSPFAWFWRALAAGVDGMPPGYYLIVKLSRMLPGDPLVTLRLPSILGYLLCLLGVYLFIIKRLPAVAGLVAVLFITLSPFRAYALEARSYSLLVGLLAISVVCWQRIGETRFMTPLFALFLMLAVSCHYLAIFTILSIAGGELAYSLQSRRIRWRVWAACLAASGPFFLGLPLLLHIRHAFNTHFWAQPTWSMIGFTYGYYVGLNATFVCILIIVFLFVLSNSLGELIRPIGVTTSDGQFSSAEIILVCGFLLYPALLVVLTRVLGSGYVPRYGWPAILGLVLASVYLSRPIWPKPSSAYLLVALLVAFVAQEGSDFRVRSAGVNAGWVRLAELSRDEPRIPVVIASPLAYLEAVEYAPSELRDRLVEVVDENNANRFVGSDSPDKTNRLLAQFIPLRVINLASFQVINRKFILRSGGAFDWLTEYLVETSYHLTLLSRDPDGADFIAER
jgi:Dolichyl-phosphate-mannose-protein mannosyltransferase